MTIESQLKQRVTDLKAAWMLRRKTSYATLDFWTIGKSACSLRVSFYDGGKSLEYEGDTVDDLMTRAYDDLATYLTPEEKTARDTANLASVLGITA